MPRKVSGNKDKLALADVNFQHKLTFVRAKSLPTLTAKSVKTQGLTVRDLLNRVDLATEDIAPCIPMADSTLRGVCSARTDWQMGFKETNRFCALLQVSYEGLAQAWFNRQQQTKDEFEQNRQEL